MNNYQASFTNQRQITFPCANLHAAKLEAKQYAIKHNLYVSNVKQR